METYNDILNPIKTIIGEHAKMDVRVKKAIKKMKDKKMNPDEVFFGDANRPNNPV